VTDPLTYVLAALRRATDNSYSWSLTPTEAGALVAEVEHLREKNADLRLMVDGLETAAHEERAAVVAWLREVRDTSETAYASDDLDYAIAVIERGAHRTGTKP